MKRGGLFSELRRRRVWRVAGAYVFVGWMAVEIVLETFPLLGFPDWVPRLVVVLAFLGLPVTIVLAWAFDITPQGVVRTAALDPVEGATPERVDGARAGTASAGVAAPVAGAATATAAVRAPARLAGVFGAGIVVALVGFGAYAAYVPGAVVRPEQIESLAVLPFRDLSADGDQRYFADGVTDELIGRLAQLDEIRVAARTSSFAFRNGGATLDEIGRELRVDAVIEGSVRRDGDRLRVSVELVDVASGFQIWAESYDRTADDIFAIQDDISSAVVDALRLHIAPAESRLRSGTASLRAHDAYLLGLARWHARTEADLLRALEYFEEATAQDDAYAPAHAGIALTYAVLPAYSDIPADVAAERGSAAAARALALNARLAEAHAAIGQISQALEWNLESAEMAYRRAIEYQPSYATGHQWYAETLLMMGRLTEARRELDIALATDPLSVSACNLLAYLLTVERRYDDARDLLRELLDEHPTYDLGHVGLALLALTAGWPDVAEPALRAGYPPALVEPLIAVARARNDTERRQAAAGLAQLEGALPVAHIALFRAAAGDRDGAIDAVVRAFDEGQDPNLPFFLVHPLFDPLRNDPRFRSITDAMGIEAPMAVSITRPAR